MWSKIAYKEIKMFWCKIFQTKFDFVLALCDEKLLGKTLREKTLKINISERFYGGELIDEKIAVELMKKATIGNLIGKEAIELAEKNGFITKENVILINGIPHAQFVKI
jgi:hypothetical protein